MRCRLASRKLLRGKDESVRVGQVSNSSKGLLLAVSDPSLSASPRQSQHWDIEPRQFKEKRRGARPGL